MPRGFLRRAPIPVDLLNALLFVLCRYLHVTCTTLLVGGTLFYEMVVPVAIGELREETQLAVFGRARWVFRWIVWVCVVLLIASGVLVTQQYWLVYSTRGALDAPQFRPGWWWAAHVTSGAIAIVISLMLTIGAAPPNRPLTWMRFNLMLLLVVMFIGSATRHVRDIQVQPPIPFLPFYSFPLPNMAPPSTGPTTAPGSPEEETGHGGHLPSSPP